ncbi:A24 family peptidase [Streptomyces sp. NPDC046727]|uniref:prepilin peptidase n=1 Tax=Streptomyces sp. NPDC046727 TaxID=3155373 RepID=UPI0033D151AA
MTTGVLAFVAAVWGALAGTLLPRAAYRFAVPTGEPWRDRCPRGHHPVRGWLGGTACRECAGTDPLDRAPTTDVQDQAAASDRQDRAPASDLQDQAAVSERQDRAPASDRQDRAPAPSYASSRAPSAPLLATATALVCAALAAATGTRPELAVWLLLAPVGVLLAAVDFRVQRLPDPLTLPLAAAALALLGVAALLPEHAGHWRTALYGALALGAGYYLLYRVNPGGMGFGDVKLAVGTGAVLGWYGWPTVLLGTFAGFLLGALYGGALVLARRADRRTAVPFGPFLLAGALTGLLIGAYAA